MSQPRPTRRSFFRKSAVALAAGATVPYVFTANAEEKTRPQSKNDRLRIGSIGMRYQGTVIALKAQEHGDIVAIADVDRHVREQARAGFGSTPKIYEDYRQLLDRKDIDVVTIGTPDHWHTRMVIDACRAGKDVYVEKPLTLTIDEGKILSQAVEETGRVVQVGTQQRSTKCFQVGVELVRNGRLGKLRQVWVALPYYSTKAGPFPAEPVPENLDWDMYQGQAPVHDYCRPRTHRNFRWWYEYAGGIITDWGNHHVDIAHWGADCELTGPTSIEARGMFPNGGKPDCFNTADRFFSRMIYPNGVEVLYFAALNERRLYGGVAKSHDTMTPQQVDYLFGKNCPDEIKTLNRNGIMFIGDKGRIFINRGAVHGKPAEELKENPLPDDAWHVRPSSDHMGDFFQCVKTRRVPVSPVQIQHRTITACHLTNISLRLGRKLTWDPSKEQIVGDDEAAGWLSRKQRPPYVVRG